MLNRAFNGNRFGAVITVLLELYLNAHIKAVCGAFLYGVVLNAYLDITKDSTVSGVTNKLVLTVGYDIENMRDYHGDTMEDRYGRTLPKNLHGTINLDSYTSSYKLMSEALLRFYQLHINHALTIRRIQLTAAQVRSDDDIPMTYKQLSLFDEEKPEIDLSKEKKLQGVTLDIKKKYGKNALLKGADLQEGATTRERNKMIGGHKA